MIANSTILYYKSKYFKISQTPTGNENAGASDPNSDAVKVASDLEKIFSTSTLDTYTKNVDKLTGLIAKDTTIAVSRLAMQQSKYHDSIIKTVKDLTLYEELESGLRDTFKLGTKELTNRRAAYNGIQTAIQATNAEMSKYMASMESVAPLSGKLFKEIAASTKSSEAKDFLKTQFEAYQILSRNTKLTAEQQGSMAAYSSASGRSLGHQVALISDIADQYKGVIDESVVFQTVSEGVATLSSDIRRQYSKLPGNLEHAILKAKQLGVSMADVHGIGENLLDVEQSVGKEIDYQLISGKSLIKDGKSLTDTYREATLFGDADKQVGALNDILESQEETLKGNNFYAKKLLAETMGIDAKKLMDMYEQKKVQDEINELIEKEASLKGKKVDLRKGVNVDEIKTTLDLKVGDKLIKKLEGLSQSKEDARTPAERIETYLKSKLDQGLNVKIIDGAVEKGRKTAKTYTETALDDNTYKLIDISRASGPLLELFGKKQILADFNTSFTNLIDGLQLGLPKIGSTVTNLIKKVKELETEWTTGKSMPGITDKKVAAPQGAVNNDAVLSINDGVVANFHPDDKVTAIVASPFGGMNERIATNALSDTLGNKKDKTAADTIRPVLDLTKVTNLITKHILETQQVLQSNNILAKKALMSLNSDDKQSAIINNPDTASNNTLKEIKNQITQIIGIINNSVKSIIKPVDSNLTKTIINDNKIVTNDNKTITNDNSITKNLEVNKNITNEVNKNVTNEVLKKYEISNLTKTITNDNKIVTNDNKIVTNDNKNITNEVLKKYEISNLTKNLEVNKTITNDNSIIKNSEVNKTITNDNRNIATDNKTITNDNSITKNLELTKTINNEVNKTVTNDNSIIKNSEVNKNVTNEVLKKYEISNLTKNIANDNSITKNSEVNKNVTNEVNKTITNDNSIIKNSEVNKTINNEVLKKYEISNLTKTITNDNSITKNLELTKTITNDNKNITNDNKIVTNDNKNVTNDNKTINTDNSVTKNTEVTNDTKIINNKNVTNDITKNVSNEVLKKYEISNLVKTNNTDITKNNTINATENTANNTKPATQVIPEKLTELPTISAKETKEISNNDLLSMINKLITTINIPTTNQPQSINTSEIIKGIQEGFKGINITVSVDPMAIDREIKFRSNSLNK